MKHFKLRLDYQPDKDELYSKMQSQYFQTYVRGGEDWKTNPHYHYYFTTTYNPASIRTFIRNNFGSGNAVYSMKELKDDRPIEYLAYIIKQENDVQWHEVPDDLKAEAESYDMKVKEEMKEKRQKRSQPQWKIIRDYVAEKKPEIFSEHHYVSTEHQILLIQTIIDYYLTNDKMVRKHFISSVATTILADYSPIFRQRLSVDILKNIIRD